MRACSVTLAVLLSTIALPPTTAARQGEPPPSARLPVGPLELVDELRLPPPDVELLLRQDEAAAAAGTGPLRFAAPALVHVTPQSAGTWETLSGGSRLWRLRVHSPGATDLNFGFTSFRLPAGATLHVVAEGDGRYEGPYGAGDNEDHGQLWTPVVPGDRAVLELHVPAGSAPEPRLVLSQVGHGYRDLFELFGQPKQGACNNDVICPEGDPWRDQIQSVAVYGFNGGQQCTGSMITSLAGCGRRQFFLTAGHCGLNAGNAPSVVIYWNYQSPTCGALSGGSLDQNQTGATFVAGTGSGGSDLTLIELDDVPDPAFRVYYSGWDRSDAIPDGCVGIHHPRTDEKAISFELDPLEHSTNWSGSDTHWRVVDWDDGTTEPGSSGSGIWNPGNQYLIGTLSGGGAACGNDLSDYYGRFAVHWTSGLAEHLDPDGVGALTAPGCTLSGTTVQLAEQVTELDACAAGEAGHDNGLWEPGESVTLALDLISSGPVGGVTGTLTSRTPGAAVVLGAATWPDLATGVATRSDAPHFELALDPSLPCDATVDLRLVVEGQPDGPWTLDFTHDLGGPPLEPTVPGPVATVGGGTITSEIVVPDPVAVEDVDVRVVLDHARVGDVSLRLRSPGGTEVVLLDRPGVPASPRGCADQDMDVTFDDSDLLDLEPYCAGDLPWYVGRAAPLQPLGVFAGEDAAGTWTLLVDDARARDDGALLDWELLLTPDPSCLSCAAPAVETDCANGEDDDLDGAADCADPDCADAVSCNPEGDCGNGEDDDLDGAADCADPDCADAVNCNPEGDCGNGEDDDLDGAADCADDDCADAPGCRPDLAVNRQVVLGPTGPRPALGAIFDPACAAPGHRLCAGGASDAVVPGDLPMRLVGEAAPSGTASLWLYSHSTAVVSMRLARDGDDLLVTP